MCCEISLLSVQEAGGCISEEMSPTVTSLSTNSTVPNTHSSESTKGYFYKKVTLAEIKKKSDTLCCKIQQRVKMTSFLPSDSFSVPENTVKQSCRLFMWYVAHNNADWITFHSL